MLSTAAKYTGQNSDKHPSIEKLMFLTYFKLSNQINQVGISKLFYIVFDMSNISH